MISSPTKNFRQLQHLSKRKVFFLFSTIFLLKLATLLYLSQLAQCAAPQRSLGHLAYAAGDTFSYTGAMENYINTGTYFFLDRDKKVLAGRMPHYSIPYWAFRQIFDQSTAYDITIVFQLLMETAGVLALCITAYYLLGPLAFYIMLALLLTSTNWTGFTYYASPESISISVLALFLWQYEKYKTTGRLKSLFFSGCFFGWLVTLKVYYLLLLIPIGIEFLLSMKGRFTSIREWKRILSQSVLYILPLLLLLAPWIVRNYFVYHKFVPFQINQYAGYSYTKSDLACRRFIAAWGGDFTYWEKTSAGCYFHPSPGIVCEFQFPEFLFSGQIRDETIDSVRDSYIELQRSYSLAEDEKISRQFDHLTETFKEENPFRYYVTSKTTLAARFLNHSGSYYLPIHQSNPCFSSWQLSIKLAQSGIYWLSLLVGLPGLIILGIRRKNILLPYMPVFLIILFPIFLNATEWRYFRTAEPVLYMGIAYSLVVVLSRYKKQDKAV